MSTYRALLVGAGGMGREWAKNLRENPRTDIVAWVDIAPGLAEQSAGELGLPGVRSYTDLGRALAESRPDFVVDVSVPEAHHDVTLAALAAGVPVLGEKPMADSMENARAMVAASERAGKLYMVSQSRRYEPNLQAFRRLIQSAAGTPLGILNSDFYIGAHFGGFRDAMASPLVLDMAIHTFDAARYLCGADAVSVYCDEFNPPWSWYAGDACATAIFEMQGGLRYTYRGSWCSEGRHTSWEGEWRAVGPLGAATWDGFGAPVAEVVTAPDGFHSKTETRAGDPDASLLTGIRGSLQEFLNALETGATPMGECHDNIRSLAMVFAAVESSATGQRVAVAA
jgi:predicted dehydrogenase